MPAATLAQSAPSCPRPDGSARSRPWRFRPRVPVRHPRMYAAYLSLSAADVVLTLVVLSLNGGEANPVAAKAIAAFGPGVLPFYKLATVLVVLGVCESLARLRPRTGATMAGAAVVVMTLPVGYALFLLAVNGPY